MGFIKIATKKSSVDNRKAMTTAIIPPPILGPKYNKIIVVN